MAESPNNAEPQITLATIGELRGVMTVTAPTEDSRHLITDAQLTILQLRGKDTSFDWCLALFGAGVGFLQNLVRVIAAMYNGDAPDNLDIVLSLACIACLAASLSKFGEHRRNHQSTDTMCNSIRSGARVQVR